LPVVLNMIISEFKGVAFRKDVSQRYYHLKVRSSFIMWSFT
jgi:hypothetical protein